MDLRFLPLRFTDGTERAHFAKPGAKIRAQKSNRLCGLIASIAVSVTGCLSILYDYILNVKHFLNLSPADR